MWSPMPPRALSGLPSPSAICDRQPRAGPERTDVVGRSVAVLALEAVAADAAVDEPGVAGDRGLGLEVELVEGVGPEVGQEHVGRGQQVLIRVSDAEGNRLPAP